MMDKLVSTRLDVRVVEELRRITRLTGMTKKAFLEQAILERSRALEAELSTDVWAETAGAFTREPLADTDVREAGPSRLCQPSRSGSR